MEPADARSAAEARRGPARADRDPRDARGTARIVAVDIARWLAIVGMMCAHLLAYSAASWGGSGIEAVPAGVVMDAVNGNSSTLFAVLAGVSMVLATTRLLREGRRAAAARAVAGRAAVLVAAGFVLSALTPPVFVVLQYLGWAMLLAIPLLLIPTWAIVAIAAALWAVGGFLATQVAAWRAGQGLDGFGMPIDALADSPIAPLVDLTLTGQYPAVTWLVLLAAGIVVGRLLLARTRGTTDPAEPASRTRLGHERGAVADVRRLRELGLALVGIGILMAGIGAVALRVAIGILGEEWGYRVGAIAVDGGSSQPTGYGTALGTDWWWQLADVPHTGTVADIARALGVALAVLGLVLALVPTASRMPRWLAPLRAAGAAPFTIYVGHVLALTIANLAWWITMDPDGSAEPPWFVGGFAMLALHVAGSIAAGWWLARTGRRGPLERATSAAARWAAGEGAGARVTP